MIVFMTSGGGSDSSVGRLGSGSRIDDSDRFSLALSSKISGLDLAFMDAATWLVSNSLCSTGRSCRSL
jgi:hypothetical protein